MGTENNCPTMLIAMIKPDRVRALSILFRIMRGSDVGQAILAVHMALRATKGDENPILGPLCVFLHLGRVFDRAAAFQAAPRSTTEADLVVAMARLLSHQQQRPPERRLQ